MTLYQGGKTEGKIKELIPQGDIDASMRLVLTNTVYFNAAWLNQFDKDMTKDNMFYLLDGRSVTVLMMRQTAFFGYAKGEGYQAVELPYDGNELSMVIMLPDAGHFEKFEGRLNIDYANTIIGGLALEEVTLTMPKFKFESEFSLSQTLAAMGMPVAFTGAADFSGMTSTRELAISEILHNAFVSVNEAGTEAAAANAEIMAGAGPQEPVDLTVDHPFIFLIRDIKTGTIVFMGRVVNPSS